MKILIVEDDEKLAKSIKKYLVGKGHEVNWVENGSAAICLLKHDMHNGIISDIQMPGGNGIELLQTAWSTFKNIPPFYVHSSEDNFYWSGKQWHLPTVIYESFGGFAIFRSKLVPKMLQEIQKWIDSIE